MAHAADALVSWADPVYLDGRNPLEVLVENQMYLHQIAGALAAERREHPGDDLFSAWCTPRWTATGCPTRRWRRSSCCSPWPPTTPPAKPPATR